MSSPSPSPSTGTADRGPWRSDPPGANVSGHTGHGVLRTVFDGLPHALYCEKDERGSYVAANQAFARRCGRRRVADVVGRRAGDLFPADLAASYEAQDLAILSTGRSVINHLEVISRPDGQLGWFLTTKVPLVESPGVLLVVVSIDLIAPVDQHTALDNLSGLLTEVRAQPARAWRVSQLATMAGISERQLERRMQRLLGTGVKAFLQSVRLDRACQLLVGSTLTLAEVAEASGYYDQSQLSRQFRTTKGITPKAYRNLRDHPNP